MSGTCPLTSEHMDISHMCLESYSDSTMELYDHIDKKSTGVQCYFVLKNNQLVCVFRGSDEIIDWCHNFILTMSEYPKGSGCYVHSGFLLKWLSIESEFKSKLNTLLQLHVSTGEINSIAFVGHSLGGGMCSVSCFASESILQAFNVPIKVITFGSPLTGNINFKNKIESFADCTRIVLDRDLVTRIPLDPAYVHIGKPIQIRDDVIIERDVSNLQYLHWTILGLFKFEWIDFAKDHSPLQYYKKIRNWVFESNR